MIINEICKANSPITSLLREFAVEIFVLVVGEFSDEVDLVDLIETLADLRLFLVLEKCVDWNRASFSGKMLSLVIGNPLVIVMEADILGSHHLEASHLHSLLLGKIDEVLSVLFLGICVVDYHTLALGKVLVSHLVALLFCLQSVPVYSHILRQVVCAESGLS